MIRPLPDFKPDEIYNGKRFFAIDPQNNKLILSRRFDIIAAQDVANSFIADIPKYLKGEHTCEKGAQLQAASLFLKAMVKRYEKDVSKNPKLWKESSLLKTLVKLDRYITAAKFSTLTGSAAPMTSDQVCQLFATEGAKNTLKKWLSLQTHLGMKGKVNDETKYLLDQRHAAEAFLCHPEEVDFLHDTYIYKHISRRNDHIHVDPVTLHHRILYEGTQTDVSNILQDPSASTKIYREDIGLTTFDAESWSEIPVFRKRKNAKGEDDYKLVIKTLNDDTRQHAWIELKDPKHVYNVGYAWETGSVIPPYCGGLPSCETIPGTFSVPDREELSGKDKDFVKTTSKITKEQFDSIKAFIESRNANKPIPYNLTASNCCSAVREIGEVVGLHIGSQENGMRLLTGKHFSFRFSASSILGKIERSFHKMLALLRNCVFFLFGGASSQLSDQKGAIFKKFSDVTDLKKGLFDYPKRIYEWQMAVKSHRELLRQNLVHSEQYQQMTQQQQNNAVAELMLLLPTDVTIEDPEDTL